MKVLLIGQADSIFFENYIKIIKTYRADIDFDVYSIDRIKGKYDLSGCSNIFQSEWNNSFFSKLKGIRTIIYPFYLGCTLFLFLKKNKSKYNIIHFKWLVSGVVLLGLTKKKGFDKTIATQWGSEIETQKILYSRFLYLFLLKKFINKVSCLTYHSKEQVAILNEYKLLNDTQMFFAIYGSTIYSEIEKLIESETKEMSKRFWKIDPNKITVSIGYSGKELHQHLLIIETLLKNKDFKKESSNFLFILPLTHGGSKGYYNKILDLLKENNLDYLLITEKMSDLEVAKLRNATDIMLQLSVSDARSASIIECFLAGTLVISGKWLPYKIFYEKGLYFYELDRIDSNLPIALLQISDNIGAELEKCKINPVRMGFETWEKVIPNWINIYEKVLNDA